MVGSYLLDMSSQHLFPRRLYQGSMCLGLHASIMSTYDDEYYSKYIKIIIVSLLCYTVYYCMPVAYIISNTYCNP